MMNKSACKKNSQHSLPPALSQSNVSIINLGCSRNLVDSQVIIDGLQKKGYNISDVKNCEVVIVNTCSFVEDARKESVDVILDLIDLKKKGKIKKIIVSGCFSQRYGGSLVKELKGVDAFVGTLTLDQGQSYPRASLTPRHYAYVKICESCYNQCSFCSIPKIKGRFVSRPIESVVAEIKHLDEKGIKEIIIIGQDITAYGMDIYGKMQLVKLLKEILPLVKNIQWIRLLYTFPAHITDELIDLIANEKKICRYIDIPLQHISDAVLRRMDRRMFKKETVDLVKKIKERIPGGVLRTTFIVGFPGETQEDFQELMDFAKETQFGKMGVFVYSREEGTVAHAFNDQVPENMKRQRLDMLMRQQQEVSQEVQKQFLGKTIKVLIDEEQTEAHDVFIGRSEFDAPEVDGVVYVRSNKNIHVGEFADVCITDTYEYDLVGEMK